MRKGKKKTSQKRYIGRGMSDIPELEKFRKKGKKYIRKPKMPARIKKNQTHKRIK